MAEIITVTEGRRAGEQTTNGIDDKDFDVVDAEYVEDKNANS